MTVDSLPKALADRIVELLGDQERCTLMGEANRKMVAEFEPVTAMNEYLESMEKWTGDRIKHSEQRIEAAV